MIMDDKNYQQAINNKIKTDPFANYLGAKLEIIEPGYSRVSLTIDKNMINFHGTAHGGIIFFISDMAFGAACNSRGKIAVALNINICFLKPAYKGDCLIAEAKEEHNGKKTSLYDIKVFNKKTGELIAKSQNQAYKMDKHFVTE
jgi:acyl-CoA thioesterase